MNNLTSQLYTEYFNIIKLEFELLNELIKRQSELHTDISRVINNHQNILSQQNNTNFNNSNHYHNPQRTSFYPSFMRNRNNLYPTRSTIFRPNRNIERRNNDRIRPTTRTRTRRNRNWASRLQTFINNTLNEEQNNRTPATIDQIINNTTIHLWSDISNNEQTICPIARTPFNNNQVVCKITHCGHIFVHSELLKWFTKDTRCPVCRYDIANTTSNNDISNNDTSNNDTTNNDTTNDDTTNDDTTNNENYTNTTQQTFSDNFNLRFNNTNTITNDNSNNSLLNLTNNISNLLFNELSDMSNNIITAEFSFNIPSIEPFSEDELDV